MTKQILICCHTPPGLGIGPPTYQEFQILFWILDQQGVSPVLHYLDNFLIMGRVYSTTCHDNFAAIQQTCQNLGIPLALEKLEGPVNSLTFFGIEIDTIRRLPQDYHALISSYPLGLEK